MQLTTNILHLTLCPSVTGFLCQTSFSPENDTKVLIVALFTEGTAKTQRCAGCIIRLMGLSLPCLRI